MPTLKQENVPLNACVCEGWRGPRGLRDGNFTGYLQSFGLSHFTGLAFVRLMDFMVSWKKKKKKKLCEFVIEHLMSTSSFTIRRYLLVT